MSRRKYRNAYVLDTHQFIDQLFQSQLTQPFHDQTQSKPAQSLHQFLTRSRQFALENTFLILPSTILVIDSSVVSTVLLLLNVAPCSTVPRRSAANCSAGIYFHFVVVSPLINTTSIHHLSTPGMTNMHKHRAAASPTHDLMQRPQSVHPIS
jgi:hypothetical protein